MSINIVPDTQLEPLKKFSAAWRADAKLRERCETELADVLEEWDLEELVPGAECKIVADTPEVVHIVFPPSPNADLSDTQLEQVVGGGYVCAACQGLSVAFTCAAVLNPRRSRVLLAYLACA